MIKQESIENLKSIIDVVDVIGNYIQLKKKGGNFISNCPFHSEKTPSFIVSPSKQIYHCFGCGASGDAINFVMEYEKLSYPEAIEKLASIYNFQLEYTKNNNYEHLNFLDKINSFYKQNLIHNKTAYQYLKDRGLHDNTIEKFSLGFAPSSKEQLEFLSKTNLPTTKALELGVLAKGENGIYARLIDRITFPIFSTNNKIIAYGGRTISNHPAKYINYTNTKLFNKSKTFYGLNFAREHILKKREIIITEGYMDVIMLHQGGFNNTVATLGTALTSEHLPILRKLQAKIIIAYDGDEAGRNAALKASILLARNGFEGGAVLFQDGLDPADMIKQNFDINSVFKQNTPFIEFVILETLKNYNIQNPHDKQKAFDEIKNFILSLPQLIQENIARYASQLMQIPINLFKTKTTYQNLQTTNKKDPNEAGIIKTLYENKNYINEVVEYLPAHIFKTHTKELSFLYEERFTEPSLLDIVLDEEVKIFDYDSLLSSIRKILILHYEKQLNNLKFSSIPIHQKAHFGRLYRDYIKRLKKGELFYESNSTV